MSMAVKHKPRTGGIENLQRKLFRFLARPDKADRVLDYLSRLQFPEGDFENEADFASAEQDIWQKHVDAKGNFVLSPWKSLLWRLLQILLPFLAGAGLVLTTVYFWKGEPAPKPLRIETMPKFLGKAGDTIRVDTRFNPKFAHKKLSLPAVFTTKAGEDSVGYRDATLFRGDTITLGDEIWARNFIPVNRDTLYAVQSSDSTAQSSWASPWILQTWLELMATAQEEPSIKKETPIVVSEFFTIKLKEEVTLREKPDPDGKPILNVPKKAGAQLVAFGPVKKGVVWINIVYKDAATKKEHQGWIIAYSNDKPFIEIAKKI